MSYPRFERAPASRDRDEAVARSPTLSPSAAALTSDLPNWSLFRLDQRFSDFLDHQQFVKGHSPESLKWYIGCFNNFRKFLLSEPTRASGPLGPAVCGVEAWIAWNRRRQVSAVGINNYWRGLRTFFTDIARRDGHSSPFQGLQAPSIPSQIPKARTAAECQRILQATAEYPWFDDFVRTRALAILGLALYAGVRRKELIRLQFSDVDLPQGLVRIQGGKGRAGGKDRHGYIPRDLRILLEDYLRERAKRQVVAPEFFTARNGVEPLSVIGLRRLVAAIRRASGVPFSLHVLRHCFVSHLLRQGTPMPVVRDLAGHASVRTTEGYLRVFDEDKRRYAATFSYRR